MSGNKIGSSIKRYLSRASIYLFYKHLLLSNTSIFLLWIYHYWRQSNVPFMYSIYKKKHAQIEDRFRSPADASTTIKLRDTNVFTIKCHHQRLDNLRNWNTFRSFVSIWHSAGATTKRCPLHLLESILSCFHSHPKKSSRTTEHLPHALAHIQSHTVCDRMRLACFTQFNVQQHNIISFCNYFQF